ncbi:MAG: acyl carrier protein [Bacteroidales bacterium]|nr:acyl carrier protein [Bacteroidales bacterium]
MEQKFFDLLKEAIEIEDHDVNMEDLFREYPEWSSLAYLSIIAMLDEEYDVQIEEAEFKTLRTVADLYNAIQK